MKAWSSLPFAPNGHHLLSPPSFPLKCLPPNLPSKVREKMNTYAKYVRARFERGNLIVEVSKDAFKDAEAKKETVRELQQIIKAYFGIRFFIRLSIVYAFTALFCAFVALIIVLLK